MTDQTDDWPYTDIPAPPPRLERPRDRGGRLLPARNQPERDAWAAARWTRNNWTYQEIADALGYASKSTAHDSVQRGLHAIQHETELDLAKSRATHRARLSLALEVAMDVMAKEHVHVSNGRVVHDADGTPVLDDGPALAAADRVRTLSESLRKLDGLDAPTQVQHSGGVTYEVIGIDPAELA